jgi:hypothetical protein
MPLDERQRAKLVTEFKSWTGTPYRGWSARKGPKGGVDCGQIIKAAYVNTGFLPADIKLPEYYSLCVAQHKEDTRYIELIETYMREIPEPEAGPGDVVVYKLGHAFAHSALIVEWPRVVIHAWMRYGVIGAHGMDHPNLKGKLRKFYALKDEFVATESQKELESRKAAEAQSNGTI